MKFHKRRESFFSFFGWGLFYENKKMGTMHSVFIRRPKWKWNKRNEKKLNEPNIWTYPASRQNKAIFPKKCSKKVEWINEHEFIKREKKMKKRIKIFNNDDDFSSDFIFSAFFPFLLFPIYFWCIFFFHFSRSFWMFEIVWNNRSRFTIYFSMCFKKQEEKIIEKKWFYFTA